MPELKHGITLNCNLLGDMETLELACTCGWQWGAPFPVEYTEIAIVLNEHLKEQNLEVMKAVMRQISPGDILRALRGLK